MEAAAADRLEELAASFARAGAVVAQDYAVAGSRVSFRFAGDALRDRLTPAFAHLAAPSGEAPELIVHLWDAASTGVEPPPRPAAPPGEAAGALYHFNAPPLRGAYQAAFEALSVLDSDAGVAWYWVADARNLPSWERACPIRQILFWWLAQRGYLQVHGAAVGTPEGGVLIVGPAGSGKSTVALACLGSELLYAGDDYVAVTLEPSPRVASLYNSGKIDPVHLDERLPRLLPYADHLDGEKAILYAERHFPQQTTSGFPLAALLVPAVRADRREPRVVPASRAASFAALGPSTMFQLHTAGAGELATLSSLVARVPCYTLELGSDLTAVPETISDLL
ncbi:MAG TPA: hypothetical protein VE269_08055 [Gaiellaceae bacterium]|nr:hypothetical protein [Gaiellaceae bacterium]